MDSTACTGYAAPQRFAELRVPLSPIQKELVLHSRCEPASGLYIQQLVGRLQEPLNVPLFKHSWRRIIRCHPIFRATLDENQNQWVIGNSSRG